MNSKRLSIPQRENIMLRKVNPCLAFIVGLGLTAFGALYYKGRTLHKQELERRAYTTNYNYYSITNRQEIK